MIEELDFSDVLILPQRNILKSRKDVNLIRNLSFYHSPKTWEGIPIICSNMAFAGYAVAKELSELKIITCLNKFLSTKDIIRAIKDTDPRYTWVTIGEDLESLDKAIEIKKEISEINICIDVANAYRECFVEHCIRVRKIFPEAIIMAGNIVTPEMGQELIIHGKVDISKVGIGSGKNCQTRMVTGVGRPQLSSVQDCSKILHGLKTENKRHGLICSDGGCRDIGDIAKAFVGGADFVMLGSMFAGCSESAGDWENGCYIHYGLSSHHAAKKHNLGDRNYRASEGIVTQIPDKGPVKNIVKEILGGLRSTATYIGSDNIKDFPKCGRFIKVNK